MQWPPDFECLDFSVSMYICMLYCNYFISGLAIVESRVGERMAERLVSELGLLFDKSKESKIIDGRRRAFASLEDLFKPQPTKSDVIEEIILSNGQKQSR